MIIGITLHPLRSHGATLFRFIRAYRVANDIKKLLWELNPGETDDPFEICSEEEKLDKESKKRRKVSKAESE